MRAALLLTVLLLTGCGGPPDHFYTLAAVAPAEAPAAGAAGCAGSPVSVNRVLLPEILDRQSIVRTDGADRVDISSQDRWAAPLDGMIRGVLAADLRDRLPPGRVLLPGDAAPAGGAAGLDVNIQHFSGDTHGRVVLRADWMLLDRNGKAVLTRSEVVETEAAASGTASIVVAMNQALGGLATRIAGVLPGCV